MRDILLAANSDFVPYHGDGIDVDFLDIGGSDRSIDVALKHHGGDVIIAECRYRKNPSEQVDLDALSKMVDRLREKLNVHVVGVFATKVEPREGLVKVAEIDLIPVIVAGEEVTPATPTSGFSIEFHTWDPESEKRLRAYAVRPGVGGFEVKGQDARLTYVDSFGERHSR